LTGPQGGQVVALGHDHELAGTRCQGLGRAGIEAAQAEPAAVAGFATETGRVAFAPEGQIILIADPV
jgi:hypothetical protein